MDPTRLGQELGRDQRLRALPPDLTNNRIAERDEGISILLRTRGEGLPPPWP